MCWSVCVCWSVYYCVSVCIGVSINVHACVSVSVGVYWCKCECVYCLHHDCYVWIVTHEYLESFILTNMKCYLMLFTQISSHLDEIRTPADILARSITLLCLNTDLCSCVLNF